jgi:hypothetical protein
MDRGEMADAIVKLGESANAERARLLDEADRVAMKAGNEALRPNVANIAAETRKLIAEQYYRGVNSHIGEALERDVAKFEKEFAGAGFRELQQERTAIDKTIKKFGATASPEQHAYIAYRGIIEDEIKRAGDAIAKEGGSSIWSAQYQAAKDRVRDYIALEQMSQRGAAGDVSNRIAGLGEHLGGLGVSSAMGAAGAAIGGPVGGMVGHGVGSLVGGALGHYAKHYGSQHIAELAGKAANSDVLRAITQHIDQTLSRGVAKAVGAAAPKTAPTLLDAMTAAVAHEAAPALSRKDTPKAYNERRKEVLANVSSPARMQAWANAMSPTDEDMRMKLLDKAIAKERFLASKLPVSAAKPALDPHAPDRDPAPAAMDKFLRYQRAADEPMSIFDDLERGRVSRESIEAVKAIYPAIYEEVRTTVQRHVLEQEKPPSYQQQLQLGILLDIPVRPIFQNVTEYQQIITTTTSGGGAQPKPDTGPKRAIHIDNATTVSRIEGADT